MSQFFETLKFSQDILGNVHYVCEINLISEGTLISRGKKSETRFCRRKTAQDDNSKINVSPNIPCTFLLFKSSAFIQIFFPRKSKFSEPQLFLTVNV